MQCGTLLQQRQNVLKTVLNSNTSIIQSASIRKCNSHPLKIMKDRPTYQPTTDQANVQPTKQPTKQPSSRLTGKPTDGHRGNREESLKHLNNYNGILLIRRKTGKRYYLVD